MWRAAAGIVALTLAAPAAAQPAGAPTPIAYELRWVRAPGAESCSDARELAAAVSAVLGREAFDRAGADPLVLEGLVEPVDGGWKASLSIRGADDGIQGRRELGHSGADCREIDESLVLVLALIVDRDAATVAVRSDGAAASSPRRPATTQVVVRPPPWHVDAVLAGAAATGVLPGASVGGRLTVGVDSPRMWPFALGVSWWLPESTTPGDDARSVSLTRWQLGAAICTPERRAGSVGVAACGGGGIARVTARGMGSARDRTGLATAGLASVQARASLSLAGPAFMAVAAGADAALTRPRFVDDGGMMVHHVPRLALAGSLGFGVRF